jgi:hypothetical protein
MCTTMSVCLGGGSAGLEAVVGAALSQAKVAHSIFMWVQLAACENWMLLLSVRIRSVQLEQVAQKLRLI